MVTLESVHHLFDMVALPVLLAIVPPTSLQVAFRWNDRANTTPLEFVAGGVTAVAAISREGKRRQLRSATTSALDLAAVKQRDQLLHFVPLTTRQVKRELTAANNSAGHSEGTTLN